MLYLFFLVTNWYGMYIKENKVGYSQVSIIPVKDGYKLSEFVTIKLSLMGVERSLTTNAKYELNSDFSLNSFSFKLKSEAQEVTLSGGMVHKKSNIFSCKKVKRGLKMKVKTGGSTQTTMIETRSDKIYPITAIPFLFAKNKEIKEIEIFDPSIQSVNTGKFKLLYESNDSIIGEFTSLGAMTKFIIDTFGILLYEEQPMDIIIKKESMDEATKFEAISAEVLSLYGIKSNILISNPRDISYMKLLVDGDFLKTERQIRIGDTLILQTIGPKIGTTIKEHLEATPFIQSNDKRIINLAKEIVGDIRDPFKKVSKLVEWVAKNVEDEPSVTVPSALDVLESMRGDCGEHSVLLVALARAAGIPADIVVGLCYVGDGFYYHAWAKVWCGRWVEVDPTFGQPMADATHIALAEGELPGQAKIMKLVNKIKIKILEYK